MTIKESDYNLDRILKCYQHILQMEDKHKCIIDNMLIDTLLLLWVTLTYRVVQEAPYVILKSPCTFLDHPVYNTSSHCTHWNMNYSHKTWYEYQTYQYCGCGLFPLAVREITKSTSTFSATNISSNMIWFFQLHDTIKMKWNYTGINYNHDNIAIRSHIMIFDSV